MTGKNNNIIKTNSPVDYETAQRFIADFHFLWQFRNSSADFYNNPCPSPVYRDVFIAGATSLLESSEMVLESLYRAFPAEFLGYCSDSLEPIPPLTKRQKKLIAFYLENNSCYR